MKTWQYNPSDNEDMDKWAAATMERVSALFHITFDLYANAYIKGNDVPYARNEEGLKEALVELLHHWRSWGGGFVVKYNKDYWIACPLAFSVIDMSRHKVMFAIEGERDYREKFGTIGIGASDEQLAEQIIGHLYC